MSERPKSAFDEACMCDARIAITFSLFKLVQCKSHSKLQKRSYSSIKFSVYPPYGVPMKKRAYDPGWVVRTTVWLL